jgi:hypothetical protein
MSVATGSKVGGIHSPHGHFACGGDGMVQGKGAGGDDGYDLGWRWRGLV